MFLLQRTTRFRHDPRWRRVKWRRSSVWFVMTECSHRALHRPRRMASAAWSPADRTGVRRVPLLTRDAFSRATPHLIRRPSEPLDGRVQIRRYPGAASRARTRAARRRRWLVFPDAHYGPAQLGEHAVRVAVSRAVRRDLGLPPLAVGSRACAVLRTAVPEAAVDEDATLARVNATSIVRRR